MTLKPVSCSVVETPKQMIILRSRQRGVTTLRPIELDTSKVIVKRYAAHDARQGAHTWPLKGGVMIGARGTSPAHIASHGGAIAQAFQPKHDGNHSR